MKPWILAAALLVTLPLTTDAAPKIDVFFSPQGGCTTAVTKALDGATNTVMVQAYSFRSAPIAKAPVDAHERGVMYFRQFQSNERTSTMNSLAL